MIQFSEASIESLIVHRVGNSVNGDGVSLSNRVIGSISDDLKAAALMHYLLSPFKGDCFFNFTPPSDLSLNTVYDCCIQFSTAVILGQQAIAWLATCTNLRIIRTSSLVNYRSAL